MGKIIKLSDSTFDELMGGLSPDCLWSNTRLADQGIENFFLYARTIPITFVRKDGKHGE